MGPVRRATIAAVAFSTVLAGTAPPAAADPPAVAATPVTVTVDTAHPTLDRDTLWVPRGQQPPDPLPEWVQDVVTPADIERLDRFLRAAGWRTAVRGDDGRVRIAVIQKEDPATGPVRLDVAVGRGSGTAQVLRLSGSGLAAADTTVQGGVVDGSGRLAPGRAERVRVRDGRLAVDLPAGSAALITLDSGCS